MMVRAIVENGRIVLPAGIKLADGTEVTITVIPSSAETPAAPSAQAGANDDSASLIGDDAIDFGISDLAAEHDHYIYGTPKRKKD